ncbi:rds1 protein [Rutstroemia sp. NJR-2017a BBW]|nr:rds1 protein [Rutstroemia sp. NJR-2017a BBW]
MLRQHTSALYLLHGLLGLALATSTAQNVVSVPVVLIPAIETAAPTGTQPGAAPSLVSSATTGITTHGPYSGTPTTTGAEKGPATISATIPSEPNPWATYYNPNGKLTAPQPMPYMPAGGVGVNGTLPVYMVQSDFDYQSIALGLHQEYIELDLFHYGLEVFSEQDFIDAGLTVEDRHLIEYMSIQEAGHATLLTNMLGQSAPKQCIYDYPFTTVREFIDFNVKLTRWGESGTWGFLSHLNSKEVATLLVQAEAIEARQQAVFRQMLGLHAMPIWFAPGVPQSWHWTLLAPYISSCPQNNTRLVWQNFPALHIEDQPNPNRINANQTAAGEIVGNRAGDPSNSTIPEDESCIHTNVTGYDCSPGISRDRNVPLSFPGRQLFFTWDDPGLAVGPNNSYVTSTTAGPPKFVAWVSQLNLTYTPLTVTGSNAGFTYQPPNEVYETDPAVNGTVFVALTDSDLFLTPFNLTLINPHVRALGLFQAG